MGEKEEGRWDKSSHSKQKTKGRQVSIFKEKHSRYIPPTNQGWEKKKRGEGIKAVIQSIKLKVDKFQSSKKSIKGTYHPLIRGGKKRRGEKG